MTGRLMNAAAVPELQPEVMERATTGSLGGAAPYWQSWSYDATGNRLSPDRTRRR